MSFTDVACVLGAFVRHPNAPGRYYQDVTLRRPSKIHFIIFENYFVHSLAVQHRMKDAKEWAPCMDRLELMTNAWCEDDAQETHCLNVTELTHGKGIDTTAMYHFRFHMFQPAHTWKTACIRNVRCVSVEINPTPPPYIEPKDTPDATRGLLTTAAAVKALVVASAPAGRMNFVSAVVLPGTDLATLE